MLTPIPGSGGNPRAEPAGPGAGSLPPCEYPSTGKLHHLTNCLQALGSSQIPSHRSPSYTTFTGWRHLEAAINRRTLCTGREVQMRARHTQTGYKRRGRILPPFSAAPCWRKAFRCQRSRPYFWGKPQRRSRHSPARPPAWQLPPQGIRLGDFQIKNEKEKKKKPLLGPTAVFSRLRSCLPWAREQARPPALLPHGRCFGEPPRHPRESRFPGAPRSR